LFVFIFHQYGVRAGLSMLYRVVSSTSSAENGH